MLTARPITNKPNMKICYITIMNKMIVSYLTNTALRLVYSRSTEEPVKTNRPI